ncbi:HU family DNA-binding protein [Actinomadura sp. KC06]|uniref:HU family DNA-binding protein n=1 Tax=Actinomadura sp. KC06 TaxID=2530369 RepID=UPI001404A683|nr:HU family DNA-binding protein [Actinomadura sp. KC06]
MSGNVVRVWCVRACVTLLEGARWRWMDVEDVAETSSGCFVGGVGQGAGLCDVRSGGRWICRLHGGVPRSVRSAVWAGRHAESGADVRVRNIMQVYAVPYISQQWRAWRMNRSELVRAVAERAGSDEAAARRHVDAVVETVMERVSAGERVIVTGFGTFDRLSRPARNARNPRTGLPIEVPAAEVPRFRSGQTFRNRVAESGPSVLQEQVVEATAAEPAVAAAAAPDTAVSVVVDPPSSKAAKNGQKPGKKSKKGADAKKVSKKGKAAAKAPKASKAEAPSKKRPRKSKSRAKASK